MKFKTITTKLGISLLLILTVSIAAFADTIRLKNGSIIKGRIVSFAGGRFTVAIGDGARLKQLTFAVDEVESIVFDAAGSRTAVNADPAISTQPRLNTSQPAVLSTTSISSVPRDPNAASKSAPPIVWRVKVLADNTANGWTNSGWVLKKGQRIRITGSGTVSLGKGKTSTASGIGELADEQKLLKNVPTGALLAVIGDDNNDFIYVGGEREFVATRDGALFLGINEGFLDDNSGAYDVKVEILPDLGQ